MLFSFISSGVNWTDESVTILIGFVIVYLTPWIKLYNINHFHYIITFMACEPIRNRIQV
ncbi:hypothetical protein CANFE03_00090 [Ligilactobacillus animalis]